MPFNPKGKAQIENINIRRGTADDANVSVDIKFSMEDVAASVAASALGADDAAMVENSLFRPVSEDSDRSSKFLGLKSIDSSNSWEGKHAITIGGFRRVRAHKVGKISLKPRGHCKFDLDFSVSIEQPPQGYVENLAEHLNGLVDVYLEHDAELFDKADPPKSEPRQGELPAKPPKPSKIRSAKKPAKKAAKPKRAPKPAKKAAA